MNRVQCFSGIFVSQFSQLFETQIETAAVCLFCLLYIYTFRVKVLDECLNACKAPLHKFVLL